MGESDRCRVAICDDELGFRQVLSIVLGLEPELEVVGEAANGREAVRLVAELSPDVLILDVAMPELDGIEALPLIREASPGTRVVMLSGFGSTGVRQRSLDGGASLFMEKGADPAEIVARIRELCS